MDKLEEAKLNGVAAANNAKDLQELDAVRVNFLGKKGEFAAFMRELGKLSAQERPQRGAVINEAKQAVVEAVEARRAQIEKAALEEKLSKEIEKQLIDDGIKEPTKEDIVIYSKSSMQQRLVITASRVHS